MPPTISKHPDRISAQTRPVSDNRAIACGAKREASIEQIPTIVSVPVEIPCPIPKDTQLIDAITIPITRGGSIDVDSEYRELIRNDVRKIGMLPNGLAGKILTSDHH